MTGTTLTDTLRDSIGVARDLGTEMLSSMSRAADRLGIDTSALTRIGRPSGGCGCAGDTGGGSSSGCACSSTGDRCSSDCGCSTGGGCRRPPACWLPERRPDVTSVVCPGGTARIRVTVHNCGLAERRVFLAATGNDAALATGAPSVASVGALESAQLVAELTLPKGADRAELVLWVHGCHDTALRWTVSGSEKGCDTTHELCVQDCPRTQHHWYDHFAQPAPCAVGVRRG